MVTRDVISILVQIGSLLFVIVFSAIVRKKKSSIIVGVIVMSLANIFANIVFGEGHTAFPGLFIFPLYGIVLALITVAISNAIHRRRSANACEEET